MPTYYIVLQRNGNTSLKQLGVREATGPNQAIKAIAKGTEGIYVAVPVRNWTEAHGAPKVAEPQFLIAEIEDPFGLGEQTTIEEALRAEEAEREHMTEPVKA